MKELILELSNLTFGQIDCFTLDEAIVCIENFNKLKETTSRIWIFFEQLAARNHFRGSTVELISNHASGIILETATEFIQLTIQCFPSIRIKETAILELYQTKAVAEVYLEYKKHENSLELSKSLVSEHVDDLIAEQDSALRFY